MQKATKRKPIRFIAVEGGEGSGKSSILAVLKEMYSDKIVFTREPGGSPYAELIRTAALKNPLAKTAPAVTTMCLMFAARFDNVSNLIKPALEAGNMVIADRFDASSYAYQARAQSKGDLEELFWEMRACLLAVPDLYIFLDVDPVEGIRRANLRNQTLFKGPKYDHFDDREITFHADVRKGYRRFFKKVPHLVIDANRPLAIVTADFVAAVKKKLKLT